MCEAHASGRAQTFNRQPHTMPVNQLESWISLQIGLPRKTVLSRAPLRTWQRQRLLETVKLVRARSPWYRERLQGISLDEHSDIHQILQALPFTTAADIREHGQDMVCCSQSEIQRVVTLHSSGTSAPPKRIFFTAQDLERTRGFFQHGMRLVTAAGSAILVLLPSHRPNDVGSLLVEALQEGGFAAMSLWPAHDPEEVARAAKSFGARCIVGMPQHILPLARDSELSRLAAPSLESVLLCSDVAVPAVRQAIAEELDCRVHTHYGSTESGLGGAVECPAGLGCHIRENDLLFEVIDPESGYSLPEGSDGELVFTTLTRCGMPLVRYRTGDWGRMTTRRCTCGSILSRLQNLRGRLSDVVRLPGGGTLTLADLDQALLACPRITAFEAELREEKPDFWSGSPPTDILDLTLTPAAGQHHGLEDAVRKALQSVPAIQEALTAGGFRIKFALSAHNPNQSHTVKRQLRKAPKSSRDSTHAPAS